MKKYLTVAAAGLLLVSTPSFANNTQKINIVKKINAAYINDIGISDEKIISRYADNDLKRWIRLGSNPYGPGYAGCYSHDVRIQAQDSCNVKFTYGISPKGYVDVEVSDRCGSVNYKSNLQYKLTNISGSYKISDIFIKEDNGNWSSWKQGFKDCYASR